MLNGRTTTASHKPCILLLLLLGLLISTDFLMLYYKSSNRIGTDFVTFYETGKAYLTHQSLYQPERWITYFYTRLSLIQPKVVQAFSENLNPPFYSIFFSLFSHAGYGSGFIYFTLLNLVLGIIGLGIFYQDVCLMTFPHHCFLWLMVALFGFYPTYMSLSYAQLGALTFLLVVLLRRFTLRQQWRFLGITLGIACSLKLFFLLFMVYYFFERRFAVLAIAGSIFLLVHGLGVLLCGIQSYYDYFQVLQSVDWQTASENASIAGFLSRFFGGSISLPIWQFPHFKTFLCALSAIVLLGHLWAMISVDKSHPQKSRLSELHFHLVLVMMLLLSPLGWRYYFSFYLITFIFLLEYLESREKAYFLLALTCLSILLIGMPGAIISRQYLIPFSQLMSRYSFAFYALITLWITLMAMRHDILKQGDYLAPQRPLSTPVQLFLLGSFSFSFLGVLMIIPSIVAFYLL